MIESFSEDLAGEYQAIVAYCNSQVLKGAASTNISRESELHGAE